MTQNKDELAKVLHKHSCWVTDELGQSCVEELQSIITTAINKKLEAIRSELPESIPDYEERHRLYKQYPNNPLLADIRNDVIVKAHQIIDTHLEGEEDE